MLLKTVSIGRCKQILTNYARCYATCVNGDILKLKNRGIFQNVFPAENV
jgi:hypothetical protein